MSFSEFRATIQLQVDYLLDQEALYVTNVDKHALYEFYLASFPPKTNNLYITRTEHDCSACKHFICTFGGVVAIVENKLVSVWDVEGLNSTYAPVAAALSNYVKSMPIADQFMYFEAEVGIASNVVQLVNGDVHTYTHLHAVLPSRFVQQGGTSTSAYTGKFRESKHLVMRALTELTTDAVETVLDLISQNSLYRGEESKELLQNFLEIHRKFLALPVEEHDTFCWAVTATSTQALLRIRNSAIGSLLANLSKGVELNVAVSKFELVVAPTNYKRPKAAVTKSTLESAQKTVVELGLLDSLPRRFATVEDIKIQNVLFANANVMRRVVDQGVFAQMSASIPVNSKKFEGVEEVPIYKFVTDILPRLTSIELLLKDSYAGNLVSVIAPANPDAPSLFKWGNGFSWAYSGNVTDSMKQRVKKAGGSVDGVLRFSIQWNEKGENFNDFDAWCLEPNDHLIYYMNKGIIHKSSGVLDVDVMRPRRNVAVENITWSDPSVMPEGVYTMKVHTYADRGGVDGFRAEIEFDGETHSFNYSSPTPVNTSVEIAKVTYSKTSGFSIKPSTHVLNQPSSNTLWNKSTNQFHPVTAITLSPNYWDEQKGNGNKHFLFLLDDCINDEKPNGFFNEFLRNDLMPHKRVFEALGGMMQVSSDNPKQLSGVGFSSTKRNSAIVKVAGHIQRTLKITF